MKKQTKKLALKKLTISKLNNIHLINGGEDGGGSVGGESDAPTCGRTDQSEFWIPSCFLCPTLTTLVEC